MISPEQCRMARAGLRITVRQLAARAGVSATTINRLENDHPVVDETTLARIRHTLEARGVVFTDGVMPGVALRQIKED